MFEYVQFVLVLIIGVSPSIFDGKYFNKKPYLTFVHSIGLILPKKKKRFRAKLRFGVKV